MKIEMINSLAYTNFTGIKWQIEQVAAGKSDELWLATPHEDATRLVVGFGIDPSRVYDMYRQQYLTTLDEDKGIWWTDLPRVNEAQMLISQAWQKSMVSQGQRVADIKWYPNSQRIVQAVTWLDADSTVDYKDIYHRDGTLFAKQYFSEGQLLQTDFYGDQGEPVTRDFYFEGNRNFVVHGSEKFNNADNYVAAVGNQQVGNDYNITQLGRELNFAPQGTTLTIIGDALDETGHLYENLLLVLQGENTAITQVKVSEQAYGTLKRFNAPMTKVKMMTREESHV
jgi:hypothetical protein